MAKSEVIEYRVFTAAERQGIVADFLRAAEAEHYRLLMSSVNDPSRDERLSRAADEVKRLQTEFDAVVADGA